MSTPGCGPIASSDLAFSGFVLGLVEVVVIVVALVVHSGGGCAVSLVYLVSLVCLLCLLSLVALLSFVLLGSLSLFVWFVV